MRCTTHVKRLCLVLAAGLALVAVSAGHAKGPIQASIEGPGLGSPIEVGDRDNFGEEGALAAHQPIMVLAEEAGFFRAAFGAAAGDGAKPVLDRRPSGELGPRYVVTYLVPGPEGQEDDLLQHLYPYAAAGPVSYMPPGQPFFGWRKTTGGWYRGGPALREALFAAGLPESPPTASADDASAVPWNAVALLAAALALGAGAVLLRRRPHPAT
jgi:hypothetical protein